MTDVSVDLFDGPSELRGLCRSLDWSATPLGPVSGWPAVLRSTVQLCLDSGFPILVNWGSELVAVYNDAFAPLIGGKHPEALGRSAKSVWPEAWEEIGTRLDDVLVRGATLQFINERQLLERNGYPEECYFTFSHSPIRDTDGTIVGLFTASTETTGQILAERRMRIVRDLGTVSATAATTLNDTCRAMLEVLARTRETIPFAVAYLTGDPSTQAVAAYGLADARPHPAELVVPTVVSGVVERVVRTGRAETISGLRERCAGLLQSGPIGPLPPDQAVVLPLGASGRETLLGAVVLGVNPYRPLDEPFHDFFNMLSRQIRVILTDALAYESELRRVRMLADLDTAKTEFFQNVSHELRTPLTLLLAPLQDLLAAFDRESPGAKPEQVRSDLEVALRSAERLRRMVDALLDLPAAGGTLPAQLSLADLAELTADLAGMFRSTAEHAGLQFLVTVPPVGSLYARVDTAMWATIVNNLLSNAVKYTGRGTISVDLTSAAGTAVLTVSDTGAGIAPAEQPHVFERFYRAADENQPGGAGIGLALVEDLVHAQGGQVELTSAPGVGTTVTVAVPTGRPALTDPGLPAGGATERPGSPPVVRATAAPGDGRDMPVAADSPVVPPQRLLLVEDDDDLRAYLARLLTGDGWVVTAAADVDAAEALIGQMAFDLVLTDLLLPGRNGLDLVTALRGRKDTARLPIIVLTANSGADAAVQGLTAGADDYLTKPFPTRELLARVRAHHQLHQLRERAVDDAHTKAEQIRGALNTSRTIGTALGVLMAAYQLTSAQGFQLLVAASQHSNRKLRDIADDVVDTGKLPFRPTDIDVLLLRVIA